MAGIELVKTTVSSVAHQTAHYDEEKRASSSTNHKNKHINKELSHLNYCIGDGVTRWRDIMDKARETVKKIDKEKPPIRKKKDRKTMGVYDIWCPNDIKDDRAFFNRVYEEIDKAYPNSLVGMQVHVDEQHEYIDPRKKEVRMSMRHAHSFQIPNDPVKGINAKTFFNRAWYRKMNEICQEVAKEFGSKYHTGEGHIEYYEGRTQEQLKVESAKAAIELANELNNIQNAIVEESEVLTTLQTNEKTIVERITSTIKAFIEQNTRKTSLEQKTPHIKRDRVFGKANKLQERFWSEIPSTYSKIGRVDAPEDDLKAILEEYDKELTKIENAQNEPISSTYEEETIDDIEL